MSVKINGKAKNIIFMVFISISFIVIFLTLAVAARQRTLYLTDYRTYITASQLVSQDKYAEAKPLLQKLEQRHSGSYQIAWLYGLCLAGEGNYPEGAEYLKKAGDLRPALLMNQNYLVQYGEILYHLGNFNSAKRYLEESGKYGPGEKAAQLFQKMATTNTSNGETK